MTSLFSTGYGVRRFDRHSARAPAGTVVTEQNGLGPHPVVQEDAKRPGCTTTKAIFSSTVNGAFFFQEKKNGGFKAAGLPRHPRSVGRAAEVVGPYGCNERSPQQRHAIPRAWPPPTKFRAEIWGVGQVVVPYALRGTGARHAAASCPTGDRAFGTPAPRGDTWSLTPPR